MKRKVIVASIILICLLLQNAVFPSFAFASITPNLMIVVASAFGFMRGQREGLWTGFFCGVCVDIFSGGMLGFYALLYMYIGFTNGYFHKLFYPEDIKLPMLLIAGSDLFYNLAVYFFMFFFRGKFHLGFYLKNIILPELVYTMLVTIILYMLILKINQRLELVEKRSAKKFV